MTLIKVFHPYWDKSVFCKKVLKELKLKFKNSKIDIHTGYRFANKKEQKVLKSASKLIFIFPIWWYGAPANYKKWKDDVIQYGVELQNIESVDFYVTLGGAKFRYTGKNPKVEDFLLGEIETFKFLQISEKKIKFHKYFNSKPGENTKRLDVWFKTWGWEKKAAIKKRKATIAKKKGK